MSMPHKVRGLAWASALACLFVSSMNAQVEFTNNFKFNSGQSIQPIFEGWSRLPDGSFNLHFGYLNRNYVEQPSIPVGMNNHIDPGGPDRGQPTYFYPRTHRNLFTVNVPRDWDRKREVIWTVTFNGKIEKAFGWLQPEWEIDPAGGASGGGNVDPGLLENKPPTLTVPAVAPVKVTATASLVAAVSDDGLPKPKPPAKRAVGQESPPTLQGGTDSPINVPQVRTGPTPGATGTPDAPKGLRVSWMVWRGPTDATFEPVTVQPKDGKAVSTVTFTQPGEYVLRATATDGEASVFKQIDVLVR
jgi:hypothetical protein